MTKLFVQLKMQKRFFKKDVLITTTTELIMTTSTTTIVPTTRPIPTFTPIPITSKSTTKSTKAPIVTSSVIKTTPTTSPSTVYATEPFVKDSKILILNSRNFHKSMTISETNQFQNANITFEVETQAYKACSVWFFNQL